MVGAGFMPKGRSKLYVCLDLFSFFPSLLSCFLPLGGGSSTKILSERKVFSKAPRSFIGCIARIPQEFLARK